MTLPGPTIADDTLHYIIYPKEDAALIAAQIQTYVESVLPGHIWHRDSFQLAVTGEDGFIQGYMRVGDCIDDEWLVVWLLWQVSGKWDAAISVYDSDGEFLLIEAAQALPAWVTPYNAENRVWIYRSSLHLIPLTHISPPSRKRRPRKTIRQDEDDSGNLEESSYLDVEDALPVLRDDHVETAASKEINDVILRRISRYPQAIKQHVHRTTAYLPVDISRALVNNPSLVQKAVETFYTRDALQLRATQKMARFPPSSKILTAVVMTRTAYAQLSGQRFQPPRIFGHPEPGSSSKEVRRWDIGVKIACGFEMLYQETKSRSQVFNMNDNAHVNARLEALGRDTSYKKYITGLQLAGYFGAETPGSAMWKQQETKAANMWIEMRREDDTARPSFSALVEGALADDTNNSEPVELEEDPDDWLNVDARDLEQSLATYAQKPSVEPMDIDSSPVPHMKENNSSEENAVSEEAKRLKDFAEKFGTFIEQEGDEQGVLFDDDLLSDDESSDEDDEVGDKDQQRRLAMENLVPAIDPQDYGRLPTEYQYRNSQKTAPVTLETEMTNPTSSETETVPKPRVRRPIIPRDKFDGVDSDDESSASSVGVGGGGSEEEDQPQIIGEVEIDMAAEEEEFLAFSRDALGIDDEAWEAILTERRKQGAFVPRAKPILAVPQTKPETEPFNGIPRSHRVPDSGPRPNANPNLDSFEAVMQAMDAELAKQRSLQAKSKTGGNSKGKAKARSSANEVVSSDEEDIDKEMDSELRRALKRSENDSGGDSGEEDIPMDYNLIKNFLESFKAQQGTSGPVSNLAGMLGTGWVPRDS